ncbi:uncharacterized protein LOC135480888 [Liolophura sinensis]|uniref:uncharacterized protein LOC135480888 n=1 Tax=Liolophura sinensis TaxID=3198878 RepID=UPI003158E191
MGLDKMTDPVHASRNEKAGNQKPSLPYGWIVRQSSTYPDRVYFFNTVTGASSWEPPILVNPSKQNAAQQFQGQAEQSSFPQGHQEPHHGQTQGKEIFPSYSDGFQGHIDSTDFHQCQLPESHHGNNHLGFAEDVHNEDWTDGPHFSGGEEHVVPLRGQSSHGRNQSLPGRGQPFSGRGQPVPARGHLFPGRGHPLSGRGQPLPGRGHPLCGRGHPLSGRGHPLPGSHIGPGRGPVGGRGQILPGTGQKVLGRGQPYLRSFPHESDIGHEENNKDCSVKNSFPDLQGRSEEARGRFHGLGRSQPLLTGERPVQGRGHRVRGKGKKKRRHNPYKGKRVTSVEKQKGQDVPSALRNVWTHPESEGNGNPSQLEEKNLAENTRCIPSESGYSVVPETEFEDCVPKFPVDDDIHFRTLDSQFNHLRPPEFSGDEEDEVYQLVLESPTPVDFDGHGHNFESSFSPECRDWTTSPVQDVRLVTAQDQLQLSKTPDAFWEELDSGTVMSDRAESGLTKNLCRKSKRGKNSVWTTREPDTQRPGVKSRLGTREHSQSYNPNKAHVRPENARKEVLERFRDSPVPKSPPYSPQVCVDPSRFSGRKAEPRQNILKEKSPVKKDKKRRSDVSDEGKSKRSKKFYEQVNISKSPPKISEGSETKSLSEKKLTNDPVRCKQKVSQFKLSEDIVPAIQIYDASSPPSRKNTRPQAIPKKVRLKRGSLEEEKNEPRNKNADVPCSASDQLLLCSDPIYNDPLERGHLKDPDKLASIQSWVNKIEDTPVPFPSSSPDTTRSTLSTGSTLSDDKFKIPLEAGPGNGFCSESPASALINKEFSDSGYSTSTCTPVTMVTGVLLENTQEMQEVEGMEVDEADLQVVRSSIQANPEQYFGALTQTFSSADTSVDVFSPDKFCQLFIVLDTNVLMSQLDFVEELRDMNLEGFGRPILVIPWVVLQELDALKNKQQTFPKLTWKTQNQARAPVQFLYKCFDSKHPRVKGQSSKEASQVKQDMDVKCNDDRVLLCCLQWKEKNPESLVVLFTEDVNLATKATVSNIKVFTRKVHVFPHFFSMLLIWGVAS